MKVTVAPMRALPFYSKSARQSREKLQLTGT